MLVGGKTERGARGVHELRAAFAVRLGGAGDFGDAFADERAGDDELRLAVVLLLGAAEGLLHGIEIVAVHDGDVPADRLVDLRRVFALGELGHGVERDVVGIVNQDEVVEGVVRRERDRLTRHAFLEAAVARECDDVVVENRVVRRVVFRRGHLAAEREADGVADALAERAGGAFDARGFMKLRMPRRDAVKLAEIRDLLDGQIVAREVEPAIEEHGAVARREDEAVAVEPARVRRVALERLAEEHRAHFRRAERQAEVAGVAFVHGVHGETAGLVGGFLEEVLVHGKFGRITYRHGGGLQDGSGRPGTPKEGGPPDPSRLMGFQPATDRGSASLSCISGLENLPALTNRRFIHRQLSSRHARPRV